MSYCSISFNNSRSVISGCAQPQPRAAAAADGLADDDTIVILRSCVLDWTVAFLPPGPRLHYTPSRLAKLPPGTPPPARARRDSKDATRGGYVTKSQGKEREKKREEGEGVL